MKPALGWIQHPDRKRRYTVALVEELGITSLTASREGVVVARERVTSPDRMGSARLALTARIAALPSGCPVEAPPPIMSLIARAERIADLVLRRRDLVSELAQLDAEIDSTLTLDTP